MTNSSARYPRARLSANLQDAHVYVFRRAVLEILAGKPRFQSLREEFFPWLCALQYHRGKRLKYKDGACLPSCHSLWQLADSHLISLTPASQYAVSNHLAQTCHTPRRDRIESLSGGTIRYISFSHIFSGRRHRSRCRVFPEFTRRCNSSSRI